MRVVNAGPESIGRRYAATLFAQSMQLASAVVTAGIVPRFLGAAIFGNYSFLLNMAASLRGLTEPSAQQAFFTLSAQEEQTGSLTKLYALWMGLQLCLLLGLIGLLTSIGGAARVWPGQRVDQIVLVTLLDWTMFLALSLRQLGDSKGLTVRPQLIAATASAVNVIVLAMLLAVGQLTFSSFVWLNIATAVATAIALVHYLLFIHRVRCWAGSLESGLSRNLSRWWAYAQPLIVVECYMPLVALMNTYLIQAWYGSAAQGHFALASRWSALVLLFTGSAVSILWRELAAAVGEGDMQKAAGVYDGMTRPLMFAATAICCWLSFSSRELVTIVAGPEFLPAVPILAVMAFYPLAQTIGQLSTAGLKAIGLTAEYRNLAISLSIPDIALTYLFLAPRDAAIPGLELGALGVAIKMTGYAFLTVQLYQWRVVKHLGLSAFRMFRDTAITLALVAVTAVLVLKVLRRILDVVLPVPFIAIFTLVSLVYFAAVVALAVAVPSLGGATGQLAALQLRRLATLARRS
jgi:O-antigen/teichoic acid export membrane protein